MRTTLTVVFCLGIFAINVAQPVPAPDKVGNSTTENGSPRSSIGSPSDLEASKIVESGVAATVLSYGRVPSYESSTYSTPYPTANCHGHAHGYYGNPSHQCKIFHVCQEDGRLETFDCPPYTKFNNYLLVCDWPHKVDHNCDPVYKDEQYPVQSNNNAYPIDKSYVPNFMNLYPLPNPTYSAASYVPEKPVYPVLPVYSKSYEPVMNYGAKPYLTAAPYNVDYVPYKPVRLQIYEKNYAPIYPTEKPYQAAYPHAYPSYEKFISHKSYPVNKSFIDYLAEKPLYPVEYPVRKSEYSVQKPVHNAHAYPVEKPLYPVSYDKPSSYNTYPMVEKHTYSAYSMEKPVRDKPMYSQVKPVYDSYAVEKPVYSIEQSPAYPIKPMYPIENPSYERSAYQYADKAIYPLEKPAYLPSKSLYGEKIAYPVADKVAYPVETPVYNEKPSNIIYPGEKHHERPSYPITENYKDQRLIKKSLYKPVNYGKSYKEYPPYAPEKSDVLPLFPYNSYAVEQPIYNAYAEKSYAPYNGEKNYSTYKTYEKDEKYPTVASYAAVLRNYGEHASRYEPQYGYSPMPYTAYRARLAGLLRNY